MTLRVKADYVGKVRLSNGLRSVVLTETTEQAILAEFYGDDNARFYMEEVEDVLVSKPEKLAK